MKKPTYLDGLKRAHSVAMGCLPLPCGSKKKRDTLLRMGTFMGIVIQSIEQEIKLEESRGK